MKIIGLDVGTKRIGVAKADSQVKIALSAGWIDADGAEIAQLTALARTEKADLFVVGLPRNNSGAETRQSLHARNFARGLKSALPGVRVVMQDESFTSVEAEERLKMRGRPYQKGDIDAEAAAIILQDFLEKMTARAQRAGLVNRGGTSDLKKTLKNSKKSPKNGNFSQNQAQNSQNRAKNVQKTAFLDSDEVSLADLPVENSAKPVENSRKNRGNRQNYAKTAKNARKMSKKAKKHPFLRFLLVLALILVLLGGAGAGAYFYLSQPVAPDCGAECAEIEFTVAAGDSAREIAANLEKAGLVRSALVFRFHYHFHYAGDSLKSGAYLLSPSMTLAELIETLIAGPEADVFSFTFLPGEDIFDFKDKLVQLGYSETEVETALSSDYDYDFLPANGSLEGFLFGETYEFYADAAPADIVERLLTQFEQTAAANNLEAQFAVRGLTLFEGVTLASIVQKEANNAEDYAKVAQVFYKRLEEGMTLGSDITVQYALDLVDPDRAVYTDNAAALKIDSPYNTRLYAGLPPGPVSSPGLTALLATANPADTDYLFFLTGDDGLMYYSSTAEGHAENITNHCQVLCNATL